jgi:hypothetical protein
MITDSFRVTLVDGHKVRINQNGRLVYVDGKPINIYKCNKGATKENSGAYLCCTINGKMFYVHRLVALAWIDNPENKPFVLHKDTRTTNNFYLNLMWGEHKDLIDNMKREGRTYRSYRTDRINSKLGFDEVIAICEALEKGETIKYLAEKYDVHEMSIRRVYWRYMKNRKPAQKVVVSAKNVMALYRSGMKAFFIAKQLNQNIDTIEEIIAKGVYERERKPVFLPR